MGRRRQPQPLKEIPEVRDLFGNSLRYAEVTLFGPKVYGYRQIASFQNRISNYTTATMERLGNIQQAWHGTKAENLVSIAHDGLLVATGRSSCLFGRGIYFSPVFAKAFGHSWGYVDGHELRCILKCYVALGKVLHPKSSGDQRAAMVDGSYHSVVAQAGVEIKGVKGAWTGRKGGRLTTSLQNEEWIIYDNEQAVANSIFVYTRDASTKKKEDDPYTSTSYTYRPGPYGVPQRVAVGKDRRLSLHPCHRDGQVCTSAYDYSGCIVTNRKKGCTKNDGLYCKFYTNTRGQKPKKIKK